MDDNSNLLDRVFNAPEEQVETFADTMQSPLAGLDFDSKEDRAAAEAGAADPIKIEQAYKPVHQSSGMIIIEHGWHGKNYVWHISPASPRKWAVTHNRVYFALFHTMNKYFPVDVKADVFPPMAESNIPEITLKAYDVRDVWSIDDTVIEKLTQSYFEVLNTLI